MTYLFEAQVQKYYYDYYKVEYNYLYVNKDGDGQYRLSTEKTECKSVIPYRDLITILDNQRLNEIGEFQTALSKSWYSRHNDDALIKHLKNNTKNYFCNLMNSPSTNNLWTTFVDYRKQLAGNGYTKGFAPSNIRAVNEYKNKDTIAYLVNKFFNPFIKRFFESKEIKVDEDLYATSEMLQFIWRSAIRDGKPINIYIPSKRMRTLLQKWIDSVSNTTEE